MNSIAPLTVDPVVLADIGGGDPAAGAARLRLAISDLRRRERIVGPTQCPASVRVAVASDEPALEALLEMDVAENAIKVAPFSLADIQDLIRAATRETGRGVIGVIDGPDGVPVAVVVMMLTRWWWSSAWFLQEVCTFVAQDHRGSRHARDLVLFARYAADRLSEDMGYRIFLLHGITATSDADRKVRLLTRMSNYVGSFFCYPHPGGAQP